MIGTADYIAPEILKKQEADHGADWWALGVMIFEILTGGLPFNAKTPEEVFDNILHMRIR